MRLRTISALIGLALVGLVPAVASAAGPSLTNVQWTLGTTPGEYVFSATDSDTNTGAYVKTFIFQLTSSAYTFAPTVTFVVNGRTSTSDCAPQKGGTAPSISCTIPAGMVVNGTHFAMIFATSPPSYSGGGFYVVSDSANGSASGTVPGPTGAGGGGTIKLLDPVRGLFGNPLTTPGFVSPPGNHWTGLAAQLTSAGTVGVFANEGCTGSPDLTVPLSGSSPTALTTRPFLPLPGSNNAVESGTMCAPATVSFPHPTVSTTAPPCTGGTGTALTAKVPSRRIMFDGMASIELCVPFPVDQEFDHAAVKTMTFKVGGRTFTSPLMSDGPFTYDAKVPVGIVAAPRSLAAAAVCRVIAVKGQIGALARTAQGKIIVIAQAGYVQIVRFGSGCPNVGAGAAYRPGCSRVGAVTFVALPNALSSPGATDLLLPCTTPVGSSFSGAWRPNGVVMYDVVSYHNLVYSSGHLVPGAFPVRPAIKLGWTPAGPRDIYATIPAGTSPGKYVIVINVNGADVPEDSETTVK